MSKLDMVGLVASILGYEPKVRPMDPFEREAHYSKIENDRRKRVRRQEERCECQHGHFWHGGGDGDGRCMATTKREPNGRLILGINCPCVEFIEQPDRRES